jgi:UDP-N-acetylmuramoylalanine--D-glutamate ligase
MKNYKQHFTGKKITMLGLGLLGRGLNDAKFLAECGADLIIADLKTAEQLKPTLKALAKYKNIKYTLGEHKLEDFKNRDYILKAAGVPLDSPYTAEARKNNIPIKMDASWFAELAPNVKIVGVTGTRGKSTTTYLIYELLKAFEKTKVLPGQVFLGGNIRGLATLPYLKKVKEGDVAVLELDSWQLQGFGEAKISPNISIFTNLLSDHLNYYLRVSKDENEAIQKYFMDKAQIFANQKSGDFIILEEEISKIIGERFRGKIPGQILKIGSVQRVKNWKLKIKGEHNQKHVLRALEVAKIFGLDLKKAQKVLSNFNPAPGRQELVRVYKGIKIYNDTNSTTPDAALVALRSLSDSKKKNLVLLFGGADKSLNMSAFVKEIPMYCKQAVLLSGTGTEKLKKDFPDATKNMPEFGNLKDAVKAALALCKKGDSLALSPAFASFGMFKNEYDRGDQFVAIIKKLK